MILVFGGTTPSAPPLPEDLSCALAPSGVRYDHEEIQLIDEKIRNLEKVRDTLKIKNLESELTAAKYELNQSREVISNSKKTLLDSALSQLKAYEKLESLGRSLF